MAAFLSAEPLAAAVIAAFELHPQVAAVGFVVLAVAAFLCGMRATGFLLGRRPVQRELLRPIGTVGAAPTGSASRPLLVHFVLLCFAMGAALHAGAIVGAAAELHLHKGVVVSAVLAVALLFHWAVLSLNVLVASGPAEAELKTARRPTASAAAAFTASALIPQISHYVVLCATMAAALHAEPLVAAAADLHILSGVIAVVALFIAALFNWAILSLNFHLARRPAEREHTTPLGPDTLAGSAVGCPNHSRSALSSLPWCPRRGSLTRSWPLPSSSGCPRPPLSPLSCSLPLSSTFRSTSSAPSSCPARRSPPLPPQRARGDRRHGYEYCYGSLPCCGRWIRLCLRSSSELSSSTGM
ncbi:hypothetical protein ACP70R_006912 [Stipagrostis hirtigluma subsp. patula]